MPRRRHALLALLALGGCAGQGTTRTGFLTSYDAMAPTPARTHDQLFVAPAYARAHYAQIIIEPVAWHPAPESPPRSPEEIAELTEAFQRSLAEQLGKEFTLAAPGAAQAGARQPARARRHHQHPPGQLVDQPPGPGSRPPAT